MDITNVIAPVEVGEFIRVAGWHIEGMVIATRPCHQGPDGTVEVLVERDIDDPKPRWYRLEPTQYEVL